MQHKRAVIRAGITISTLPLAVEHIGPVTQNTQRRLFIVTGRANRNHATITRPQPVSEDRIKLNRLVTMKLIDQRQRRQNTVSGVSVSRQHANSPPVSVTNLPITSAHR